MDGNTDMPGTPDTGPRSRIALYLPTLMVLVAGLALAAFTASVIRQYTTQQAYALLEARHTAMINALADFRELAPDAPDFSSRFNSLIPDGVSVRIDTLETHSKMPVFESSTGHKPEPERTLRSQVYFAGETWLVSSAPDQSWLMAFSRKLTMPVWISGISISVFGAVVCGLMAVRWHQQKLANRHILHRQKIQNRELSNIQTEKRILRQALSDSEQRSRDLVTLSGGIVCELDEAGLAGYVSEKMADMLGFAPADIAGVNIDSLIAESDRKKFNEALVAARQDRQLQRLDLTLIAADQASIPATMRALALHDTLHGFNGYRLILQSRH